MTIDEAAKILHEMREKAAYGEKTVQAILFAIEHHDQIEKFSKAELSRAAAGKPTTCAVELGYGVKLSKYVTLL